MSQAEQSSPKWTEPFQTEQDAKNQFLEELEKVITLVDEHRLQIDRERQTLVHARRRYESWVSGDEESTNAFLAPGVRAAAAVAEQLFEQKLISESFSVANIFGELGKILVARRREKYLETLERLLCVACRCYCDSFSTHDENKAEVELLSADLHRVFRYILGTRFDRASGEFRGAAPDMPLAKRIIAGGLVEHFDGRLRGILKTNRPGVQNYVRTNMPLVYKLELPQRSAAIRSQWEALLESEGFEDLVRSLRTVGDLVNVDQVGELLPDQRDEVRRAANDNDMQRVYELLRASAQDLTHYLYTQAQEKLDYREPYWPRDYLPSSIKKCRYLARSGDQAKMRQALRIAQDAWSQDSRSLEVRDWVAYLFARTGNLQTARDHLEVISKRRHADKNFATNWNRAVVASDSNNIDLAYRLLLPLLQQRSGDSDLVVVLLALSHQLQDYKAFLSILPRTLNQRFHPLGITVAHDTGDEERERGLLGELVTYLDELETGTTWRLPDVGERLEFRQLKETVNSAIISGRTEQLVAWLRARIDRQPRYGGHYSFLSQVYEEELDNIDEAFLTLQRCCQMELKRRGGRSQERITNLCREMLELARRKDRSDLGKEAYSIALKARADEDMLQSFSLYEPESARPREVDIKERKPESTRSQKTTAPSDASTANLTDRHAWVTAQFARMRTVSAYVRSLKAVNEFTSIISKRSLHDGPQVIKLINDLSGVIETFQKTSSKDHDARRILHDRASEFEKRLANLMASDNVLSPELTDMVTPYVSALESVIGDLSKQAGVGPSLKVSVESPFISVEGSVTTLVVSVENTSERPVTDVDIRLAIEEPPSGISLDLREFALPKVDSGGFRVLNVPLQITAVPSTELSELVAAISIRASAEGFPDFDLGIVKPRVPIRSFSAELEAERIPKLFQPGDPLKLEQVELFQGRTDVISKFTGSFEGGAQKGRYFLDGIRRSGKTSILNFLPQNLPENVIPILIDLEEFDGLQGPINSPLVLRSLCRVIQFELSKLTDTPIQLPEPSLWDQAPAEAVDVFMREVSATLPQRTLFLMIDEFQKILRAIARGGPPEQQDTLVLDLLRAMLDKGRLFAIFTGSVRFDRLSRIVNHRILGSLNRLRVSFLQEQDATNVLRKGMGSWVSIFSETFRAIYQATGGYPWLLQTYGNELVDLLNHERRTVVTPEDVEKVTKEHILCSSELFDHWWPTAQLGADEERFVEVLLREYGDRQSVAARDFFAGISNRDRKAFNKAFDNLCACEVLDSQSDHLRFRGAVLRRWLEQNLRDGQLKVRIAPERSVDRGHSGIFIDHENFICSLKEIAKRRGQSISSDIAEWFKPMLSRILSEAEKRVGRLYHKVTVAFWDRPEEQMLLSVYLQHDFHPKQPEDVKTENAVDFKVADEVRRASERSIREQSRLSTPILVCGDGDLTHASRGLVHDDMNVQVWAGRKNTARKYAEIVGQHNIVAIEDIL